MIVYICEYTKRVCYKLLIYIYREVVNIIILHTNIYFYIFYNLQVGGEKREEKKVCVFPVDLLMLCSVILVWFLNLI